MITVGMYYEVIKGKESEFEEMFESVINEEGCTLLGWREVPVDLSPVGATTLSVVPRFRQVFIGGGEKFDDPMAFERKLYVIRKQTFHQVNIENLKDDEQFYMECSEECQSNYKLMFTEKTYIYNMNKVIKEVIENETN